MFFVVSLLMNSGVFQFTFVPFLRRILGPNIANIARQSIRYDVVGAFEIVHDKIHRG